MVKKLKKMAHKKSTSAAGLLDSDLAHSVKDSAQQIWLAGMGAFAKAQEEGGKVFEALVKEGTSLQKKTQGLAEERISAVTGKMTKMADGMSNKAGAQWDKLESIFEQRVAKALNKMGVPSSKDIDALIKRIDGLSAQVGGKRTAIEEAPHGQASCQACGRQAGGEEGARPSARPARRREFQAPARRQRRRASVWPSPAAARWARSTRSARCARSTKPSTASTSTASAAMSVCRPAASSPRGSPTA